MLPRKVIIAIVIVSILVLGYEGLSERKTGKLPNLLFGFTLVGAINAVKSFKELMDIR